MSKTVYSIVTDRILEQLETVNPSDWEKPWFAIGHSAMNAVTGIEYRGINQILLGHAKYWASFKQWKAKGCSVKKGEKASLCVFWKFSKYEHPETGEEKESALCRYYNVFHAGQVEGEYAENVETRFADKLIDHSPIEHAAGLIQDYLSNERIPVRKSDRACYVRHQLTGEEYIQMPEIGQFRNKDQYYSAFFHEIGHSTGADKRLNRDMSGRLGNSQYAKEELVAELTACFLSAKLGIEQSPRPDHAQYLASWLQGLRNDKSLIISAASKAQKACDFIQESAESYRKWIGNQPDLFAAE